MTKAYGRWFWWALCALWLAVILGHSLMSADLSKAESGGLLAWLAALIPGLTEHLLRKLAHLSEFALLGFLLSQCFRVRVTRPLLAGLLCALCDETVQLFVPGRSGEVRDLWIDFAGVALGVGLVYLLRFSRRKHTSASE